MIMNTILNKMYDTIVCYEKGDIDLNNLRKTLKSNFEKLDNVDNNFRNDFYDNWGAIEEVYAGTLSEGYNFVQDQHQHIIIESVAALKKLIEGRLSA